MDFLGYVCTTCLGLDTLKVQDRGHRRGGEGRYGGAVDIVWDALLMIHLVGMASLLGGALVQMGRKERVVNTAMVHAIWTQVVSGILIVDTSYALPEDDFRSDVDNLMVGIKAAVALVVLLLCVANRGKPTVTEQVFFSIFGLTLINIGVAVFWS